MKSRAIVVAGLGWWAGMLAAPRLTDEGDRWWVWMLAGVIGAGLSLRSGRRSALLGVVALAVATSIAGVGWGGWALARTVDSPLADLGEGTLVGTLRTDPRPRDGGWSALLGVERASTSSATIATGGTVWLGGRGDVPRAVRGDRLLVVGHVAMPEAHDSDDGFRDSLLRRTISAAGRVDVAEVLGPSTNPFIRAAQQVRAIIGASIERLFPPREASLLLGLALGDDSRLDAATERDFRATGLGHLLVVSGQNVAMVVAPIALLLARLRTGRHLRFAVPLGVIAFFVVLTGVESSVVRAGAMASLGLLGAWLGRPVDGIAVLATAALVLIIVDPALAHAVGFQLSAGATAGMILLAGPLADRLRRLPRPLAIALGATLAAQAFVTPLLLAVFREIPLSTIPANVLAAPAVSPALLGGLAAALVGAGSLPAGAVLATVARWPLGWVMEVADRLARAPLPWLTSDGGASAFLTATVVVGLVARLVRRDPRRREPARASRAAALAVGIVVVGVTATAAARSGPPEGMTVRFLDVGQGDAALITTPGGAAVLIDAGPDEELVARELSALGVLRLDVVVATHPHADHVLGIPAVLTRFGVGVVLLPGCEADATTGALLDEAIEDEGVDSVAVRSGDVYRAQDLELRILSPDRCWDGTDSDDNNDSVVILASVGDDRVLMTGDLEDPAQRALLAAGVDITADVLKVPHHGAATSDPDFLAAVGASVAVVSVGRPNDYGHPVPAILDALQASGARVVRTDHAGTVVVTFRDGEPTVRSGP